MLRGDKERTFTKGMWVGVRVGLREDGKRRRHQPCDNDVNPDPLARVRNGTPYRCLSRSGSGKFADCFQMSCELLVSDPAGDPVVMYAVIEGESDNPSPMG